jgi:hypothetical protein
LDIIMWVAISLTLCYLAIKIVMRLRSLFAADGTRLIGTGPVQTGTAGAGVASPQN